LIEPDHPVPQRLTIHAAELCRVFPQSTLKHGRNGKQTAGLSGILYPVRQTTKFLA
jgi:hypothetical protein